MKLFLINAGLLLGAGLGHAALIQHLDAAAAGSITVNGSGVVTDWNDLSGNGNDATDQTPVGSVLWPSTSLASSSLPGMDMGTTRNGFRLFTAAQQDGWLNFSGAAAANSGFAVLVAFKADAILGGSIRDTVFANHGNPAANPAFVLKDETAQPTVYIGGGTSNPQYINTDPAATISPGDTVVFAFNYDRASGQFELWDSKSGSAYSNTVAATDFSSTQTLYLGTSENGGQYMSGMIGEVKVFNQVLSAVDFAAERGALVQKWISDDTLLMHLDAATSSNVVYSVGNQVATWVDQSVNSNDVNVTVGTVLHPSASRSVSGLPGMDLGTNRNGFTVFSPSEQDAWLDFTGAAAGQSGFAVLVAFKADAVEEGNARNPVLVNHGSSANANGFGLRYTATGTMEAFLNGILHSKAGQQPVAAGDTIIYTLNYNAATGEFEFWDSKNNATLSGTTTANGDFSTDQPLYLGTSANGDQFMNGMVGEVKVYSRGLSPAFLAGEQNAWVEKWLSDPPFQPDVTFDNGAGDNRWTNAPNWNPDGLPGAGQAAQIAGYDVVVDAAVPSGPGTLLLSNASLTFANGATLTAGAMSNWSGAVTWTQPTGLFTVQSGFLGVDADQVAAQILLSGSGQWNFSKDLKLGTSLASDITFTLAGSGVGVAYTGVSAADAFTVGTAARMITQPDHAGASPVQLGIAKLILDLGSEWILDGSNYSGPFNVGDRFVLANFGSFAGSTGGLRTRNFDLPANRRLQLVATATSLYYEVAAQTPATGPNIIIINTDDQAGGQHFSFEGRDCLTPTLDTLVSTGLRYTSAFAASTVCGPSRYSLLTSRWPSRNTSATFIARYPLNTLGRFGVSDTSLEEDGQNIAAWLQQAGYRTGMVGKSHLIDDDLVNTSAWAAKGLLTYPQTADPATDLNTNGKMKHNHRVLAQRMRAYGFDYVESFYRANLKELYNTALNVHNQEWVTKGALDFIEENHNERFFLYMAPTVNHGPVNNNLDYTLRADRGYTSAGYLPDEDYSFMPARQAIIDQVTNAGKDLISARETWIDYSVAAIVNKLTQHGIRNDTLIIFTSDHGEKTLSSPVIWGKSSLYDLGMKVPLVMNWPSGITAPGRTYGEIVSHVDIAPTLLALTGASGLPTRPVDGVSLVPVFNGSSAAVRNDLFCEIGYARSVRTKDRKYIAVRYTPSVYSQIASGFLWTSYTTGLPTEPRPYYVSNSQLGGLAANTNPHYFDDDQLYNLTTDPGEDNNLYGQEPGTAYDPQEAPRPIHRRHPRPPVPPVQRWFDRILTNPGERPSHAGERADAVSGGECRPAPVDGCRQQRTGIHRGIVHEWRPLHGDRGDADGHQLGDRPAAFRRRRCRPARVRLQRGRRFRRQQPTRFADARELALPHVWPDRPHAE